MNLARRLGFALLVGVAGAAGVGVGATAAVWEHARRRWCRPLGEWREVDDLLLAEGP